jgi:rhodanese-related sulfurtransferase
MTAAGPELTRQLPMSDAGQRAGTHILLRRARLDGRAAGVRFAGVIAPVDAWTLVVAGIARLVDVRSPEERRYVGRVAGSVDVAWATGLELARNPGFLRELGAAVSKDDVLLFLCRSGKRSAAAAEAATEAGFAHAYNVLEGFEGDLDPHRQRGRMNGWRLHGLPWIQD